MNTGGMATRTRLTRAEAKEQTRQAVLTAAREVFEERGFHGASLEAVAERAGYTKGAVYSAFASKGELFLAIYEERSRRRAAQILAVSDSKAAKRAGIDEFVHVMREERNWSLALLEFWLHAARDPALRPRFLAAHRALHEAYGAAHGWNEVEQSVALGFGNGMLLEALIDPDRDYAGLMQQGADLIERGAS